MSNEQRNFLALPYEELEELNLKAKEQRRKRVAADTIREERLKYLTDEKRIKAVTVMFSDLEGRLHMLDYDKKFLVKSWDNLTFDGSSIRGFTAQRESDLRLCLDWGSFYWVPEDIFGGGKVLVFAEVIDKGGAPYAADVRGVLKQYADEKYREGRLHAERGERDEGFLFQGVDAEQHFSRDSASNMSTPAATITRCRATRCARSSTPRPRCSARMGFENEKDHPEVAPSQFEINYSYGEVVTAADQIQLYKLICRQVATRHGADGQLSAQAGGGRQRQRHAHQHLDQQGQEEPDVGSEGAGEAERLRLGVRRPRPDARQRPVPAAECERECVSAAGSALRGAEPNESIGDGPRLDGAHPDRQREEHARGGAVGESGCESVPGAVLDLQDGPGRDDLEDREPAPGERYLPDNIYTAMADFRNADLDHQAAGRGCEGALCGSEAGRGGPLSTAAGNVREGAGGAVPPRRVQPVFVELLLDRVRSEAGAEGKRLPSVFY